MRLLRIQCYWRVGGAGVIRRSDISGPAGFPSLDPLGIPLVVREVGIEPEYLVEYGRRFETERAVEGGFVHFFLDDERFEVAWSDPTKALSKVGRLGAALTPDFSLYVGMPLALQITQVYRNRWCGAYWQSEGIAVIPTVGWSDERSYPFCFLGVERGSTVAVSTVGLGRGGDPIAGDARRRFVAGYEEMVRHIEPELVLLYGDSPRRMLVGLTEFAAEVPTREYPSRWRSIRAERKRLNEGRLFDVV